MLLYLECPPRCLPLWTIVFKNEHLFRYIPVGNHVSLSGRFILLQWAVISSQWEVISFAVGTYFFAVGSYLFRSGQSFLPHNIKSETEISHLTEHTPPHSFALRPSIRVRPSRFRHSVTVGLHLMSA
jgi:hypothetical protein